LGGTSLFSTPFGGTHAFSINIMCCKLYGRNLHAILLIKQLGAACTY
jgi:hypothetical protein